MKRTEMTVEDGTLRLTIHPDRPGGVTLGRFAAALNTATAFASLATAGETDINDICVRGGLIDDDGSIVFQASPCRGYSS